MRNRALHILIILSLTVIPVSLLPFPAFSVTLLSDKVIAEISAGAGDTVKVWIEDNQYGAISDQYYYGDTNGIPIEPNPGYLLYIMPTQNFQSAGISGEPGFYSDFEYRFTNQEDADRFQRHLESTGNYTNIRQRVVYSNASADTLLLDDGTASKVIQVTVITENEVAAQRVNQFNGQVVAEPIAFNLRFPVIGKTTTTYEKGIDESGYEWKGPAHKYGKTGWPSVGYRSAEVDAVEHYYGKLIEYSDGYSNAPIRAGGTGNILVPANTVFVKTTMAPLEIYTPEISMAFALAAPSGDQSNVGPTAGCGVSGTASNPGAYQPDFSSYCTMGILDVRNVTIKLRGTPNNGDFGEIDDGEGIYLYGRND